MIGLPFDLPTLATGLAATIAAAGSLGAGVWISHLAHLIRHHRQVVFLADLPEPAWSTTATTPGPDWPAVAVILAARDESGAIERAVGSILVGIERDPNLRIIAVDDRSTDGTGAILDRMAIAHPRLAVVHVTDLPSGWLGKTNALQVGSAAPLAAEARWLLFTDADVRFQPGAIRRAVAFAEREGVDFVAIAPDVETHSVGERVFLSLFGLLFSLYGPLGKLSDRRSRAHVGIGAGNLVRAEAFRAVGGFRHLALSVDDDMRLGQTLKYAGYSIRMIFGRDAVAVRWQESTWGMIRGIEKNFFAGLKFSIVRVVVVVVGLLVVGVAPFAALGVGPWWTRAFAGLGIGALVTILVASGRQSRISLLYVLGVPVAAGLILVALLRSVVITWRRGGVEWRGHLYPLASLKAHVQARDAWLREVWRSTR